MVAAQQVAPLPAAVAGVVVGGPPAPPDVSHQLPTALLHLLGLRGCQQSLDLLRGGGEKGSERSFAGATFGGTCTFARVQHSRLVWLAATCGLHYSPRASWEKKVNHSGGLANHFKINTKYIRTQNKPPRRQPSLTSIKPPEVSKSYTIVGVSILSHIHPGAAAAYGNSYTNTSLVKGPRLKRPRTP